jgi:hypothetical protein
VNAFPPTDATGQLALDGLEELVKRAAAPHARSQRAAAQRGPKGARVGDVVVVDGSRWAAARLAAAQRGPKGARVGDVVVVEGSRWRVVGLDLERREVICRLLAGSRSLRRYRARQIRRVERSPASTS